MIPTRDPEVQFSNRGVTMAKKPAKKAAKKPKKK
jgi:hypothetical protein